MVLRGIDGSERCKICGQMRMHLQMPRSICCEPCFSAALHVGFQAPCPDFECDFTEWLRNRGN